MTTVIGSRHNGKQGSRCARWLIGASVVVAATAHAQWRAASSPGLPNMPTIPLTASATDAASAPLVSKRSAAAALTLDVEGKIGKTNDAAHRLYHFSEAQLLALPVHSITTATAWTRRSTFSGPLLADILKAVGAYGSEIEFHTFDDYTYSVPVSDSARYGVVVAYAMDGERLTISDFGPLFLIYPRDAFPDELTGALADAKFVWQIKALIVR